jgi:hypothetical protein
MGKIARYLDSKESSELKTRMLERFGRGFQEHNIATVAQVGNTGVVESVQLFPPNEPLFMTIQYQSADGPVKKDYLIYVIGDPKMGFGDSIKPAVMLDLKEDGYIKSVRRIMGKVGGELKFGYPIR